MKVVGDCEAMRPGFRKSEHSRGSFDTVISVLRHFVSSSSSSPASASANRSSFASDFHDPDSDAHQHLAGHASGAETLSGLDPDPDPDPDKHFTVHSPTHTRNDHKYKAVQKQDSQSEEVQEDLSIDSTPLSFSLAFKGCQGTISNAYLRGRRRTPHTPSLWKSNLVHPDWRQ